MSERDTDYEACDFTTRVTCVTITTKSINEAKPVSLILLVAGSISSIENQTFLVKETTWVCFRTIWIYNGALRKSIESAWGIERPGTVPHAAYYATNLETARIRPQTCSDFVSHKRSPITLKYKREAKGVCWKWDVLLQRSGTDLSKPVVGSFSSDVLKVSPYGYHVSNL